MTRRAKASQEDADVPDVFQDLIFEEQASKAAGPDEDSRPLKKRRITRPTSQRHSSPTPEPELPESQEYRAAIRVSSQAQSSTRSQFHAPAQSSTQAQVQVPDTGNPDDAGNNSHVRQTIIDSDESDDSDMEWEDALAEGNDTDDLDDGRDNEPEIGDISITIGAVSGEETKPKKQVRRRAITSVEKKRRLDVHKMHLLCLLYHVHRRNAWCNDERVQAVLRKLPSPKTLSNLVPNPEANQYQSSKRFMDGMNELKLFWSKRFNVTAQGMYKPRWADADADARPFSDFDELDDPMDLDDFRKAASRLEGSQDVGAQLFCAMLRGIGVEARLVCSLQCLPFASAAQPSTPQKPGAQKSTIILDPYNKEQGSSPLKRKANVPSRPKRLSRLERALGERHPVLNAGVAPKPKKTYHAAYPVYWVEVFNSAHQKWVPIDPLSTFTVNAPEKFEPPLSFAQNSLAYAIAFEDDYTAKDVTRRYAKSYNAKTRRFRVESTPHGDEWWKRALKFFKRSRKLDRDQVEDAALARKEAAEGIPKNVQDFKDHPVYVLERHLRHNEVIHPMNQVGKVNVGTAMNPKMEPIYRRRDVHIVRSADKWYRLGRDVQDGEQPLKHAKPKKGRRLSFGPDMDIEDQQEQIGAGLYAEFQTELYAPPPVVRGRVPRNAFGNLDLYVPSMCPAGGVHIRHKLASKAARIVGVDCADAVTGFSFKGRHGTAIIQGVVVAQEAAEAVEAVIDAMEHAQEEAEHSQRRSEALRMWRRFYLGLRIAQRVNAIEIDGEAGPTINVQEEIEREDKEFAEKEFAGGFFPDEGDTTEPPARVYRPPVVPDEEDEEGGGFIPEDAEQGNGFVPDDSHTFGSSILAEQQLLPRRTSSFGGGFMLEENNEEGGGFVREPSPPEPGPSTRSDPIVGGFVPDDELAEGSGGGFIPESGPVIDLAGGFLPDEANASKADDVHSQEQSPDVHHDTTVEMNENMQQPDEAEATATQRSPVASEEAKVTVPQKLSPPPSSASASTSASDAGSLLMEDPEDEDADPDWLVDAT